ncbi:MAG: hypothetical protein C4527_17240 [Candidatus Omnitrophota bacterium]|jgi:hypothetical protein|nr:MAG: hypothetical protein C4527_17240 [Candidatus Omnitrophota bacterium]
MARTCSTLFEANWEILRRFYPSVADHLPSVHPSIEIHPRQDGYYSARCKHGDGYYTLSEQGAISDDLFSFRQEIRTALHQETDLIFLLGIGLGYRLRAAWETLLSCNRGYLVLLEESPALFDAACRCSDLRAAFSSFRSELIVSAELERDACARIAEQSWFGARRNLFFWGYQVDRKAYQPDYDRLAERLNCFISEKQAELMAHWKTWNQQKNGATKSGGRVAFIREMASHGQRSNLELDQIRPLYSSFQDIADISILTDRFISQTYLMQRILNVNPDHLVWVGMPAGKWLPGEIFSSLAVTSESHLCSSR